MAKRVSKPKVPIVEAQEPATTLPSVYEPPSLELANALMHPVNGAIGTMQKYASYGAQPLDTLIAGLVDQCQAANKGDLSRPEHMLIAQAHSLDAIFNKLANQAAVNIGEHMDAVDKYLRLALRAQSQCRATLETLALIKNPPNLAFIKQQNIAQGHQQVNNGASPEGSRVGETENQQSKLLEANSGNRLDTGTAGQAIGSNQELEAVGAVHRSEVASR